MRCPGALGVKVKFTAQVCPAVYVVPTVQVPPEATRKSRFGAPCVTTLIDCSVKLLDNSTVAVCVELAVPTGSVSPVPLALTVSELDPVELL